MKDFLVVLRMLARRPGYALLSVITLAVGIGCNSAVFGLLDAVYFRPLPIREADQLVNVTLHSAKSAFGSLSYREYQDIRRSASALEQVVAIGARGATLRQNDESRLLTIHYVSGNYFDALGIPMHLGRGLSPADDTPESTTPRVVINHHLWKEQLGARSDIIGSSIRLNDMMFLVVGVTAPGFQGLNRLQRTDVWVTVSQAPFVVRGLEQEVESPYHRWFEIIGRLNSGTEMSVGQTQLETLLTGWREQNNEQYHDGRLAAHRYLDEYRRDRAEGGTFLALVGLVLLIACANVANLTLARSEARRREMAVRAALGGSRLRLLQHGLSESLILSVVGGGAGLILAAWLIELFPALLPPARLGIVLDVRMDIRLLLFTAFLTLMTILLVGVIPALHGTQTDIITGLREESFGSTPGGRGVQIRDFLVVTQVSISVVVLIAAGLLVRSFVHSLNLNPGFDTRKSVATIYLVPGLRGYDNTATHRFFEESRHRIASLQGVRGVSYAIRLPAQANEAGWAYDFTIPGREPPAGEQFFRIKYTMVGPNYFDVMGTRILRGRSILESDLPNGRGVAVINEAMARRFWPAENPIGKTILMGRRNPVPREIVGIAEDNKIASLYEDQQMYVYVPYAQDQQSFGLLLMDVEGNLASVVGAARKQISEIDASLPVLETGSFASHMSVVLFEERRDALVALSVGAVALFLGAIGVYGVVSLVTTRRTREIGIRMALGAGRRDVVRLVLEQVLKLTVAGIVIGIAGGGGAGRLLQTRLHGISPTDPWSMAIGATVLLTAAVVAGAFPSWRAAHVNPNMALRHE